MRLDPIIVNVLAAGISAMCMAVLMTAPPGHLLSTFFCGMAGRVIRDVLIAAGWTAAWATAFAAAAVVLVAGAILRRRTVSPVVLISAVLPLGATASMFNAIVHLMRVSSLEGEALSKAADSLIADIGRVFSTSLAIAVGLGAGIVMMRAIRKEEQMWAL